jgi:phage terminase large subunit
MDYEVFECFEKHVDLTSISKRGKIFRDNRYHIMHGGRGGGKSVFVAKTLVIEAYLKQTQILCARELMNSIADSSMALLWEQVEQLGLEDFFTKTKNELVGRNGSRFFFRGLKTNITSVKSIARIDRVWIEEAEAVSEDSWKVLTPSVRTKSAIIIITFNPRMLMDATFQRFVVKPPTGAIITECQFFHNRHFPDALNQERLDMKDSDPDMYDHVWLGKPVGNSPLSIIPPKWARACIDVHKLIGLEADGFKRMGDDISGGGTDPNANILMHGQVLTFASEFRQGDPVSAAYDTWQNVLNTGAEELVFDVIGVGSGTDQTLAKSQFNHQQLGTGKIEIVPYNAGGAILQPDAIDKLHSKKNKEVYSNSKAQEWWRLRYSCQQSWLATQGMDYDRDAILSIDSSSIDKDIIEKLIFEMSAPLREYLGSKLRVEPKDKLLSRGIASTNLADALIMARFKALTSSITSVLSKRRERRR